MSPVLQWQTAVNINIFTTKTLQKFRILSYLFLPLQKHNQAIKLKDTLSWEATLFFKFLSLTSLWINS